MDLKTLADGSYYEKFVLPGDGWLLRVNDWPCKRITSEEARSIIDAMDSYDDKPRISLLVSNSDFSREEARALLGIFSHPLPSSYVGDWSTHDCRTNTSGGRAVGMLFFLNLFSDLGVHSRVDLTRSRTRSSISSSNLLRVVSFVGHSFWTVLDGHRKIEIGGSGLEFPSTQEVWTTPPATLFPSKW
jgi:hypothetical protein